LGQNLTQKGAGVEDQKGKKQGKRKVGVWGKESVKGRVNLKLTEATLKGPPRQGDTSKQTSETNEK